MASPDSCVVDSRCRNFFSHVNCLVSCRWLFAFCLLCSWCVSSSPPQDDDEEEAGVGSGGDADGDEGGESRSVVSEVRQRCATSVSLNWEVTGVCFAGIASIRILYHAVALVDLQVFFCGGKHLNSCERASRSVRFVVVGLGSPGRLRLRACGNVLVGTG